jgi:hypothetical protein
MLKCDICGKFIVAIIHGNIKRWSYAGFDNIFNAHEECYNPIHGLDMLDALKKLPEGPLENAIREWIKTQPVGPVQGAQPNQEGA